MKVYFDPQQMNHRPRLEMNAVAHFPHPEDPARASAILDALRQAGGFEVEAPEPLSRGLVERIHFGPLLAFLARSEELGEELLVPYVFPYDSRFCSRTPQPPADIAFHCFDTCTPLMRRTWPAALASAASAVAAARETMASGAPTYALCRPPGHHASADRYGGYCYLNNAALAAQEFVSRGQRVLLVDIDYHHGNGTQSIFYERDDVFFLSLHAHPAYPHFSGSAAERGLAAGEGFNLNVPFAGQCTIDDYCRALENALALAFSRFSADALVISAGFDTLQGDPQGNFGFCMEDVSRIGRILAGVRRPCTVVQEGGYQVDLLGAAARNFLTPFLDAAKL